MKLQTEEEASHQLCLSHISAQPHSDFSPPLQFAEKFQEVKEAARLAREKSQDKTELTNPALNITSHQVMLGNREEGRGKGEKMVPVVLSSCSRPILSQSFIASQAGPVLVTPVALRSHEID